MKYFYEENGWQSTENWLNFRSKCSIFGTNTWCIDDCLRESEQHSHPEPCEYQKKRYGFKEINDFLRSPKGLWATAGGLVTIGSLVTITINNNLAINVSWNYENIEGVSNHKTAKFRIAVLTQENRWKFESSDSIESGLVIKELPELLEDMKGFSDMIGLIGVGTASQEGNKKQEVSRADKRADNIVSVLRHEVASNKEIYKLNLGQYLLPEPAVTIEETSVQRRLIIIGIKHREQTMSFEEMKEALKDALQKSSLKYTMDTESYSSFEFKPMR